MMYPIQDMLTKDITLMGQLYLLMSKVHQAFRAMDKQMSIISMLVTSKK